MCMQNVLVLTLPCSLNTLFIFKTSPSFIHSWFFKTTNDFFWKIFSLTLDFLAAEHTFHYEMYWKWLVTIKSNFFTEKKHTMSFTCVLRLEIFQCCLMFNCLKSESTVARHAWQFLFIPRCTLLNVSYAPNCSLYIRRLLHSSFEICGTCE